MAIASYSLPSFLPSAEQKKKKKTSYIQKGRNAWGRIGRQTEEDTTTGGGYELIGSQWTLGCGGIKEDVCLRRNIDDQARIH